MIARLARALPASGLAALVLLTLGALVASATILPRSGVERRAPTFAIKHRLGLKGRALAKSRRRSGCEFWRDCPVVSPTTGSAPETPAKNQKENPQTDPPIAAETASSIVPSATEPEYVPPPVPSQPAPEPPSAPDPQPIPPSPAPVPSPPPPSAPEPAPPPVDPPAPPTDSPVPTPAPVSPCDGAFDAANPPPACWRPYSDASPFNTRLPTSQQASPNSQAIVDRWISFWADNRSFAPRFGVDNADTANDYDHPIYFSEPGDPTYTVQCSQSASWGPCELEGATLHIPSGAQPAGGTDGHMAVIDQSSGWEYDFWQVQQIPPGGGTLTASYAGKTPIGPGSDGLGSQATAAWFGLAAGIIRPEELAAGQIDHALFMVVKCTNGTSVWPAGSSSGRSCASIGLPNADAPAMGQHFYLDMSDAQIDALAQPAWKKTILKAMAHYGLYVGDTGGGCLKIESGSSYTSFGLTDPWEQVAADAGVSNGQFDLSDAVDWGASLKVAAD